MGLGILDQESMVSRADHLRQQETLLRSSGWGGETVVEGPPGSNDLDDFGVEF